MVPAATINTNSGRTQALCVLGDTGCLKIPVVMLGIGEALAQFCCCVWLRTWNFLNIRRCFSFGACFVIPGKGDVDKAGCGGIRAHRTSVQQYPGLKLPR